MKNIIFVILIPVLLIISCSKITEPVEVDKDVLYTKVKQESLLKIYSLKARYFWQNKRFSYFQSNGTEFDYGYTANDFHQKLKSTNIDISILRAGVLILPLQKIDATESQLLDYLNNHDDFFVKLNAGLALAYLGKGAGINILRKCAKGYVLSSSGHEKNDAALGLLLLNEKLPEEYYSDSFSDSYYQLINQINN